MMIDALHPNAGAPNAAMPIDRHGARPAAIASPIASFDSILGEQATNARKTEARDAANQLVSSTFIVPILSKMRETSWAEGPFAPGTAEKRFGPMLDEHLADRIIEASNFDIVDAIAERYTNVNDPHTSDRFERTA